MVPDHRVALAGVDSDAVFGVARDQVSLGDRRASDPGILGLQQPSAVRAVAQRRRPVDVGADVVPDDPVAIALFQEDAVPEVTRDEIPLRGRGAAEDETSRLATGYAVQAVAEGRHAVDVGADVVPGDPGVRALLQVDPVGRRCRRSSSSSDVDAPPTSVSVVLTTTRPLPTLDTATVPVRFVPIRLP